MTADGDFEGLDSFPHLSLTNKRRFVTVRTIVEAPCEWESFLRMESIRWNSTSARKLQYLNVSFFFGMTFPMGQCHAAQYKCPADNLRKCEGLAEQDGRDGRG
jgi:hypothetical protein